MVPKAGIELMSYAVHVVHAHSMQPFRNSVWVSLGMLRKAKC
jgi:hypothetical protein